MRYALFGLLFIVGCGGANSAPTPAELAKRTVRVVATTGMIADAVSAIGGARVNVESLMGPGVDPHQYKASPGDISKLQNADLVVFNGLHLEGKMADVLEKMGQGRKAVAVTRDLDTARDVRPAPEGYEGVHDPHVWFDVALWSKAIGSVAAALSDLDPAHSADYSERLAAYQKQLAELHAEVQSKAKKIPKERRVLITAHDAFYYFGRAYGFEVHGLQGVSTANEPGTRDVQELAKLIGTRKVPAIFGETSVPDQNLKAVVNAAFKDFGVEVKFIPGQLFSDALGDPNTPAGTYIGMVRHNIDTIVAALQ